MKSSRRSLHDLTLSEAEVKDMVLLGLQHAGWLSDDDVLAMRDVANVRVDWQLEYGEEGDCTEFNGAEVTITSKPVA